MDANHDGIVTREEWRGSAFIFQNSDWNGDGVLSGNEATGGAHRGIDYNRNHSKDRFIDLDKNKDGLISPREWDGVVSAFNRLDDNRDGALTAGEFVNHRVEGTDTFTELDGDKDGYISRVEWKGIIAAFNQLDINHDSRLSRAEFSNHFEAKLTVPSSTN